VREQNHGAPHTGAFHMRALRKVQSELEALDAEAGRLLARDPRAPMAALVTFVVAALCLTLMEYLAGPRTLAELADALHDLSPSLPAWYALRTSRWVALLDLTLWVATRALGFVVVPALVIRFVMKRPIAGFGLALPAHARHLLPYVALFALVLPLLVLASLRPEFRAYYPFYRRAGESVVDLLLWEVLYAFQFFCVEFFFRGFLLSGSYARLGSLSVFAAMVPYCMVHFTKPVLEVLGAIPAGLVLGVLALRTGSIWGGVLLHVAVAWTMDALALAAGPGLPDRFWPE
jgi:membrane protease YdiL (CAAX protease family)